MVLCDNKKCDFLEPEGFCRLQTTLILNGVCENATDRVGKDVSVDWGKVKEAYKIIKDNKTSKCEVDNITVYKIGNAIKISIVQDKEDK